MTFPVILVAMLSGFKASVQNELNAFFAHLANQADLTREVSAQAFSKARKQFSHRVFAILNQRFMTLVASHLTTPRWNGLRVVAADASKMRLYLQDASHRWVREVIAFGLYLPGLEMMLSAELYSASVGERQMLFEHLPKLDANDLLVLDRGYPARWLIAYFAAKLDISIAGIYAEIQIHTQAMWAAKEKTHALYEQRQAIIYSWPSGVRTTPEQKKAIEALNKQMRNIYREANNND